jgi:stage V sporulation protein B
MGAQDVHALGERLTADVEQGDGLIHAYRIDPVPGPELLSPFYVLPQLTVSGLFGFSYNQRGALPFGLSLVPAVSAALARKDSRQAALTTESALRMAMILACPMGFGLFSMASPIITMLYQNYDPAVMAPILSVLGITSICTAVVVLSNSILNASGFARLPLMTMAMGGAIKLTVNYILVGKIGISGAPIGTLCCFGTVAVVDLLLLHKVLPQAPRYSRVFIKPLIASAVMAGAAWSGHGLLLRILGSNTLATIGAIGLAVVVYAILIFALRAISKDDLALMPKGEKIAKILRIR